jgi:hypothetical protein
MFRPFWFSKFKEKIMHRRIFHSIFSIIAVIILIGLPQAAVADSGITCKMSYRLKGWSFAYKQYDGTGEVSCSNGQNAHVLLASKSLGFSIGVSEIEGTGQFTALKDINEVYGLFASLEGHAGVTKSGSGQVMTRGVVSLALSGMGRGIDIGVTLGGLMISPAGN